MSKFGGTLTVLMIVAVVTAVMVFAGDTEGIIKSKSDTDSIAKGNNSFAFDLYKQLRSEEGNIFISPLSIRTALAMTYGGARGDTALQMADVLYFSLDQEKFHADMGALLGDLKESGSKGIYELYIANALWGQRGYEFLDEFLKLIRKNYDSRLRRVDFISATEQARETINAWVERKTKGKIRNLIQKGIISYLTRLVLTNAIYFKANWKTQFKEEDTENAAFRLLSGDVVDAPFMFQEGKFRFLETADFQALEMPYAGDRLAMTIFLPRNLRGIKKFEKSLTAENLDNWLGVMQERAVIVYFPRFKVSSKFDLVEVLKSLGMVDAFSIVKADLSGINGTRELFISAVVHKAFVSVNERGTEASGATGVVIDLGMTPAFRADHPFLFLIRDVQSGAILFIGRVTNPHGVQL